MTSSSSRNKQLWLAKLLVLAISLLVAVLAIEVFIRIAGLDRPLLWEPDAQLGWRHIPNARLRWLEEGDGDVRINSLGFRDAERDVRKESGVFRIAVFGDSTTEGVQVNLDQTFSQLLERRLRDRGVRAEVLNFGVSGYGPLQEYLLYTQRGREFDPDLVLHAVFLDNDVADGDRRLAAGQRGAPFLKDATQGAFEIDSSSAVASAAGYRQQPLYAIRKLSAIYRMLSAGRRATSAAQAGLDAGGQVPRRFLLYQDPLGREWEDAWRTFERVMTQFAGTVKQDGAAYAIVSMPAGQVVHPEVWKQLLADHPAMAARHWDVMAAEKRLRDLTERHQIPLIAPLDTFVQAVSAEPLFFKQIGHLTPRGHQVLAGALDAAIAERGLLSAPKPILSR